MVVIHLHELGVWSDFIHKYEVTLPETVVAEAAYHSVDEVTGGRSTIDFGADTDEGRITILSAAPEELADVGAKLPRWLVIDPGETEAIALLLTEPSLDDCVFCTADQAAVKAAVMIGVGERCESLQQLLSKVGLTKPLPHHFMGDTLTRWIERAQREKIDWM